MRPECHLGNSPDGGVRKATRGGKEYEVNTDNIGHKSAALAGAPEAPGVEHEDLAEAIANGWVEPPPEPTPTAANPPAFEGEEPEPPRPPDDEEWLAGMPIRAKLSDRCRAIFDRDALDYRRVTESEAFAALRAIVERLARGYKPHVTRGQVLDRWAIAIDTGHPNSWLMCSNCDGKGCDNGPCKRRGYFVVTGSGVR